MLRAGFAFGPEMDGLTATGLKLFVSASSTGVLSIGPASSSGRGEKLTGAVSPVVARSRAVLARGWLASISTLCALFVEGADEG